jgi:predicted ATPase/DNA-binding SARP family transcriptional activator
LGALTVCSDDGQPLTAGGARVRALLALMALEPGVPLAAERLVDGLWGAEPPASTGNALATLAKRLRASLGAADVIQARAPGYLLAVEPDAVDASRFGQLAAAGRQALRAGDAEAATDTLDAALSLWRGPALADVTAPFAAAAAARLEEQRLGAVEDRAEAQLALGRAAEAVAVLLGEQQLQPLRERLTALGMRALAGAGRQTEALGLYEQTRDRLADELGVDPSPLLRDAHLAVLRGEAAAAVPAPSSRPPSRAPSPVPAAPAAPPAARRTRAAGNLRTQVTSIVGREEEIGRIAALLTDGPLVTIVGPGGAGKTRLAVECAGRLADRWPDGTWLVELAAVSGPDSVATTVLAALGSRDGVLQAAAQAGARPADPADRLVQILAGKALLLVLDNCEHLVDEAAALASRLLGSCPDVRLLVTTQEPLAVPGEVLSPIPPLTLPPPEADGAEAAGYPAVMLFAERAAAVRPGFTLDGGNAAAVSAICRRLDGMPLAIELAAARARVLTPQQIAERLDDRFRLLTGGSRGALPRHQTLQAVVAWSWERLGEEEARTARRLSVFAGGATLDEVESLCGPQALDTLSGLVDKSLVEVDGDRYRMLETIRAYAAGQLASSGEEEQAWTELAAAQLAQARAAEPRLRSRDQLTSIEALAAGTDNAVAALRWAAEAGKTALSLPLCASLSWYWWLRGQRGEATRQARYVLRRAGLDLDQVQDDLFPAYATCLLASSIDSFAHPLDFTAVAGEQAWLTDMVRAVDRLNGYPPQAVNPLLLISGASLLAVAGRGEDALALLDGYAAAGDPWLACAALMIRGSLRTDVGDLERAAAGFRALGERWGLSQSLMLLIRHRALRGSLSEVDALMAEAESLLDGWLSAEEVIAALLRHLYLRMRGGDLEAAARDAGRARSHVTTSVPASLAIQIDLAEAAIAARRGDYDVALPAFEAGIAALAAGPQELPFESAFTRANYARALSAAGRHDAAAAQFRSALQALGPVDDRHTRIMVLLGAAVAAEAAGDPERAALILAGCAAVFQAGAGNPQAMQARDRARAALGEEAFQAASDRGAALSQDELLAVI